MAAPSNWRELYDALEQRSPGAQARLAIRAAELSGDLAGPTSREVLAILLAWHRTGAVPDNLKDLAGSAYGEFDPDGGHASRRRDANLCIAHAAWSLWFLLADAPPDRKNRKVFAATRDSVGHALQSMTLPKGEWPATFINQLWQDEE